VEGKNEGVMTFWRRRRASINREKEKNRKERGDGKLNPFAVQHEAREEEKQLNGQEVNSLIEGRNILILRYVARYRTGAPGEQVR